jgi:hypothetical protein
MRKNSIFEKQNEKDMLDILYAQRHYYNVANLLDNTNLLLIFIVCTFDFFELNNPMIKLLVNGFMASIIYVIAHVINDYIKKGADLKKYFDYTLYSFKGITKQFENNCKKNIYNILKKQKKDYKQQISNDGKSNPPGLKDWYFDEGETQRLEIIKSTQSQNIKWDKKISTIYLIIVISLVILLFITYLITCTLMKFNTIEFFSGLISFVSFFCYLFEKIISYFQINKYVYCAEHLLNKAKNDVDLMEIQEIIDKRRHKNFCPINIIHKIISKSVHEEIEYISKD